jgi:hypothetical protein
MSSGYAITNLLTGLAATAFTWSSAFTTGRSRLNDTVMDEVAAGSSSAQASGQTLVIDLGSAQAVVAIALLNHNLAAGACTVRVRAADDAAITTNVVTAKAATTINTSAPYEKDTVLQFPSVTKRYWELTFVHTGTKIVRLGELLFFGSVTTLTRQTIYGAGESERYFLNKNEGQVGHVRSTYLGGPVRTKRLPFKDSAGVSQRDELMAMFRASQGGNKNLLYIDDIDSVATAGDAESQQCLWGKFADNLGWTEDDFRIFNVDALVLTGQGREVGA